MRRIWENVWKLGIGPNSQIGILLEYVDRLKKYNWCKSQIVEFNSMANKIKMQFIG
jgi:hypothetical protein